MTSRHRVSLSAAAQADLRSILQYTLERQGAEQRRIVRERFAQVMRDLAAFPNLGRSRDDILPGLRNFPIMSHIIFYSFEDGMIRVVRILHEKVNYDDSIMYQ